MPSFIGSYAKGEHVWVPAITVSGIAGGKADPSSCTGYYQKVSAAAPGAGTPLIFNKFNAETGGYYADIDTSPLAVGMYMAFVEATVGAISNNTMYTFAVTASPAAPSAGAAATAGECISVAELKTFIACDTLDDGVLQDIIDRSWGDIYDQVGHTFGRAFRIYHDESDGATAATIEIDAAGIEIDITGGANDGSYSYPFATHDEIGNIIQAMEDEDIGLKIELLEQIPYDQPSRNLKTLNKTDIFGAANRITVSFKQWTECVSGNNEHIARVSMKIRTTVSVTEDGVPLTAGRDYFIKPFYLIRWCCSGGGRTCGAAGYWSCVQPANVCITYVPTWFGQCPKAIEKLLIGVAQGLIEGYMDGSYKSERIGDYTYIKGSHAETLGLLWGEVLHKYSVALWITA